MAYTLEYFKIMTRCINCGKEIVYGRADRKFCSEACKNEYHNRRRYPYRGDLQAVVLRKIDLNYAILERLYGMGIQTVDLITLSQAAQSVCRIQLPVRDDRIPYQEAGMSGSG